MALIHISGKSYELIHENKNGWNPEAFRNRYSEVLERYDYIIGDWGYNMLRLKGFFRDNHGKATRDSSFSSISDYINEYCNFGCAYFILEKKSSSRKEPGDEDLDLIEETPRLQAADIRAAMGAARKGTAEVSTAKADGEEQRSRDRAAKANRDAGHKPAAAKESAPKGKDGGGKDGHAREQAKPHHRPKHNGNGQQRQEGQSRAEGGEGRRREQQPRKNFRNQEHKAKKPIKLAAGEAAAASESARNRNDAGRSH